MSEAISEDRLELLRLRARIAVLERASMTSLAVTLRIRPEELDIALEVALKEMAQGYLDETCTEDLHGTAEREFVASEAARLIRSLRAQLGFSGGLISLDVG